MAEDIRELGRQVGTLLSGKTVDVALAVLVGETARILVSLNMPSQQLRPMTALVMQQLQDAIAKGEAARSKASPS